MPSQSPSGWRYSLRGDYPRVVGRIQLTSDGHTPYMSAVEDAFGADVDYAVLQN